MKKFNIDDVVASKDLVYIGKIIKIESIETKTETTYVYYMQCGIEIYKLRNSDNYRRVQIVDFEGQEPKTNQ